MNKVTELCFKAVRENNLSTLQFLLPHVPTTSILIDLINMSIRRSYFNLLAFLLQYVQRFHPSLDCSSSVVCTVKQNNLSVLNHLLYHHRVTTVNNAIHLTLKYFYMEALAILFTFKELYLSDLREPIPSFTIERLIKATLLQGDLTLYHHCRYQVTDTDGLLLFLARYGFKDLFLHYILTVKIRNHRHVARLLIRHPDPYFAKWGSYGC